MDYSFDKVKFVCIGSPRGPDVLEVGVGTKLSTIHPISEHDTKEEAEGAAKAIDPKWEPEGRGEIT